MNATDSIALYAAGIGTATAAWQVRQAVRARRPQVEVVLFNTMVEWGEKRRLLIWIQARNHGDHPVRVMGVGIQDSKVKYTFGPNHGMMVLKGDHIVGVIQADSRRYNDDLNMFGPQMPGIILARDAASRVLNDDEIAAFAAALMKQRQLEGEANADQQEIDYSSIDELILDLDGELTAWVELSTGQKFETDPKRLNWDPSGHTPECQAQPYVICRCQDVQKDGFWHRRMNWRIPTRT